MGDYELTVNCISRNSVRIGRLVREMCDFITLCRTIQFIQSSLQDLFKNENSSRRLDEYPNL